MHLKEEGAKVGMLDAYIKSSLHIS